MTSVTETEARCLSCGSSSNPIEPDYVKARSGRCGCGAVFFAERRRLLRRRRETDAPVLDPDRQRAVRAEIETEFP